jgi:hypothetical protein
MDKIFVFIDNNNLENLDLKKLHNAQIFTFNINAHKFLEKMKIPHTIAEKYLDNSDHEKMFDAAINLWNWYDEKEIFEEMKFKNVNLLSIADTSEFHQIMIRELYSFYVIKRIIEKEKPTKIFASNHFSKMVEQLNPNKNFSIEIFDNQPHEFHVAWEKMLLRFNIGNRPISIPISRKRYNQFKNSFESFIGTFLGLWYNFNFKKPSILFLEFNPSQYSILIKHFKNFDGNILFFNRRRSAIWNLSSIKILKKYGGKLISSKINLNKYEKNEITSLVNQYEKKLKRLWLNETLFSQIFSIETCNFWPVISETLYRLYKQRIREYLELTTVSQKIFTIDLKCIISLNIFGETEKSILDNNKNEIPSILLEHGATNYLPEFSKYDISNMYSIFKDKISIWGDIQKDYLVKYKKISNKKVILSGSPRHEDFFHAEKTKSHSDEKVILMTPPPLTEFNGFVDTTTYLRLEHLLKNFFDIVNNLSNTKIIVKMHPALTPSNEYVKKLIHKLSPATQIFQLESTLNILKMCDVLVDITAEFFPSTILYEGLIMEKPVINIRMIDEFYQFEFVKDEAVLSVSDTSDLKKPIMQILHDDLLREKLLMNAKNHLDKYFSNQKTASYKLYESIIGL